MMKSICLLAVALTANAAAFAPVALKQQVATTTSLNEFAKGYVGNEGPEPMAPIFVTGSKNFDPAGFCEVRFVTDEFFCSEISTRTHDEWIFGLNDTTTNGSFSCLSHVFLSFFNTIMQRAPEWIPWFRESELKHGRMAMLGVAGLVVPEFVRIPGEAYSFEAIPKVIDGHDALPQAMIQIFGWISFMEAVSFPALANMNEFDRAPGDFGFDPLNLYPKTADKQKEMQVKELKNGRLAMVACGGMIAGALITGKGFPYL